jgi:hypothetical protein
MAIDLDDDRILGSLLEGKWRLVRRIGRGGMGQVFQVVHAKMGIVKCVKLLRPNSEEVLHRRFEREVKLAQQIRHPNVIRIDDFGVETAMDPEGIPYCIMEFLEGASLRDQLAKGELPPARAFRLLRQVALGVGAAHDRDIIHRDLKPENIVVGPDDKVTVLDFGIAKLRSPETKEDMLTLTRKGEIWATPQYMSPEQAMASSDLTTKADIYALGVVLFETLTGELPYQGESARDFIFAHIQREPPKLAQVRPELAFPAGTQELVSAMLHKRPVGRPDSMRAVADALEALAGAAASPAGAAARAPSGPPRAPSSTPMAPSRAVPAAGAPPLPAGQGGGRDGGRDGGRGGAAVARPPRLVVVPHPPEGLPASRPFPVKARLFVHLGEEMHEHALGRSRVTLGRRTTGDVFVPDNLASKAHAEILEEGGRWWIADLQSRNGTFLGKRRVEGRVSLGDAEPVRIGNTTILFVRGDRPARDFFSFCPDGHPTEKGARFCGSCGLALG